jgi:hypothetical protein
MKGIAMRRRSILLASTVAAFPVAHFNTNSGGKLYVCATPQPTDLSQAQFEALTWVQVKGVGSHGEVGNSTNILTYDTWDSDVVQKAKGMTDAGSPEIELARDPLDAGQIILQAIALTNFSYAFKIVKNDVVPGGTTGTVRYNRGLVAGPKEPMGRNEDFDLEVFTLALQQRQITVNPTGAGNPPVLTVAPAITGTAQVNQVLTSNTGTFTGDATIVRTYQWFAGGVMIDGATANTYVPDTTKIGKVITVRVTGTNNAGSAFGFSPATAAVIA